MWQINVSLRAKGRQLTDVRGDQYRKMVSGDSSDSHGPIEFPYASKAELVESAFSYEPDSSLSDGGWYVIPEFSTRSFANDVIRGREDSVDYPSLARQEYGQINYLFAEQDGVVYFQNVTPALLVRKKGIISFGEDFRYECDANLLTINKFPDAIYSRKEDVLYFRRLESLTSIFRGISSLYREATESEVRGFLNSSFLTLKEGFNSRKVGKANRKRIALALTPLAQKSQSAMDELFGYIREYCPQLVDHDDEQRFLIGSDDDLRNILYGIEQRFYTTLDNEQRVANSIRPLKTNGSKGE